MNHKVGVVITGNIQSADAVIDRQRQVGDEARRIVFPDSSGIREVSDRTVLHDAVPVVQVKGTIEGVGVYEQSEQANYGKVNQGHER